MADTTTIERHYREMHQKYDGQHIDDYDVFVRSRVIEHLVNTTENTSVDISETVNEAVDAYLAAPHQETVAPEGISSEESERKTSLAGLVSTLREVAPVLVVLSIVILILRKSRETP